MKVSVVIPTHNRFKKLLETVKKLRLQHFPAEDYEILVVDDGSNPPVVFDENFTSSPVLQVLRLEGEERSIARNRGAQRATGEILIFVDDDIAVKGDFVAAHWQAHQEFTDVLAIGEVLLPKDSQKTPFGRFRQRLEKNDVPRKRGLVEQKNLCTAQNMSIKKSIFFELGGFDENMLSSEDQELALRHTTKERKIVFLPEACATHCDNALDIRRYCERNQWGSRLMLPFYQRHPDFPANIERERVNGLTKWGKEPPLISLRKIAKKMISTEIPVGILFMSADLLEKIAPNSSVLDRIYRVLLGAYIFRGYQEAMQMKKIDSDLMSN